MAEFEAALRIAFYLVVIFGIVYGVNVLAALARQGQAARLDRMAALRATADTLSRQAANLTQIVASHDASLLDCERCEIRKEWIAAQSDQTTARRTADAIARMANERKRRRATDRQETR